MDAGAGTSRFVLAVAAGATMCSLAVAPGAAGAERILVRPGLAIGGVELGMTVPEVRRILGRSAFVNRRESLGFGREYTELAWNEARWLVGFVRTDRGARAVMISTTSPNARMRNGAGVGSTFREVVRKLPRVICTDRLWGYGLILRHRNRRETIFQTASMRVVDVIVRERLRSERIWYCKPGWRTRRIP
jgi:hypothetical protein